MIIHTRNIMAEPGMIVPMVITFVVVAVVLFVGVTILGSVSTGFSCERMQGFVEDGATNALKYPSGTWAGQCWQIQQSAISSYALMIVILIIVAAAAILFVVRTFGG